MRVFLFKKRVFSSLLSVTILTLAILTIVPKNATPSWISYGAGIVFSQKPFTKEAFSFPSVISSVYSYTTQGAAVTAHDGEVVTFKVYPQLLETPKKQQVRLVTVPHPPDTTFRFTEPERYPAFFTWDAGDYSSRDVQITIISDHDGLNESMELKLEKIDGVDVTIAQDYQSVTIKTEGDNAPIDPGKGEGQGLIRGAAVWIQSNSYCAGPKPSDGTNYNGSLNPHMMCDSNATPKCDEGWRRFRVGSSEDFRENYYICESDKGQHPSSYERGRLYGTAVTLSDDKGIISTCAGPNYTPTYAPISCGANLVPECDSGFRTVLTGKTVYESGKRVETSYSCERVIGNTPSVFQKGGLYGTAVSLLQNGAYTKCSGPDNGQINYPISCGSDKIPVCASGFRRMQTGAIVLGSGTTEKHFTCEYMQSNEQLSPVVSFSISNKTLSGTVSNLSSNNAISCLEAKGRTSGINAEGYCNSEPSHWTTMPANGWSFDFGQQLWKLTTAVGAGTQLPPNSYESFWKNSQTGKIGSGTFTVTNEGNEPQYKNVTYKGSLQLDVYPSIPKSASAPVVVYIHSGGWFQGDKSADDGSTIPADIAKSGMHTVSINYTLVPNGYYPTPLEDVDCALRWVTKNASVYGFDTSQVYLGGYSSGGHLALLSSLRPNSYQNSNCPSASTSRPAIKKVFSLAGPTNLANIGGDVQGMANNFLHGASASEASPITYTGVSNGSKYLIIHAKDDELVPFSIQATPFYDKVSKWNPPAQGKWFDTGGHLFTFGRSAPRYGETIKTIIDFLLADNVPNEPIDPTDPNTKVALIGTHHDDEVIFLEPWLHIADKILTPSTYPTSDYMKDHIALKYMSADKWVAPQGLTDHNTAKFRGHNREWRIANITNEYLTNLLDSYVQSHDVIATHSPWGEYGHEQHRQIYCVVAGLVKKYKKDMYVWNGSPDEKNTTGGMPNRFFTLTKNGVELPYVSLNFNMSNYENIRNIFIQAEVDYPIQPGEAYWNNRFWTWDRTWEGYGRYQPPAKPKFYKMFDRGTPLYDSEQVSGLTYTVPIFPDNGIRQNCY